MIFDVVVIGAGAAGLMCAWQAGKRGRNVLLLEKAEKVGKKILISGGGRCNFTNLQAAADRYVSDNKHFCKSALKAYTQTDFIKLVESHNIPYHEKKLGQLFCDESARQITDLLLKECDQADVKLEVNNGVQRVTKTEKGTFLVETDNGRVDANTVVVATGGLSIPKMGANDIAYRIAASFGLSLTETRPGLVPFTFEQADMDRFQGLSGVSAEVITRVGKIAFRENVLFTHKGVSGPAILQISSFWHPGDIVRINFLPDHDLFEMLREARSQTPKGSVYKVLTQFLANRLVDRLLTPLGVLPELGNCSDKIFRKIHQAVCEVEIKPNGTEGYRKAEVTVGGVSTDNLSSKTMECKTVPGLFFIGEAVDVTGFLGGYNFQWAWSSGFVAGQNA
ncbi:NAD(P)/FAD-dependent oxidoreductase [Sneathiella limimaris]|uniref:NAD(P)/FAD-dependent oxidoreductase n=1 Tax=Sneathiella limimaris TaxID=1964213 RepID=UPI001469DC01|nr:NAD(P)/FAD-dependent oxidoreductase [Sneathiella limimaris]